MENNDYGLIRGLEGLRITTKKLSQDSRSSGQAMKPGPPKYDAGMLSARIRRSGN
jgi:hypothetical protein